MKIIDILSLIIEYLRKNDRMADADMIETAENR